MSVRDELHLCDFCGKSQRQVKTIVSGEGKVRRGAIDICNECVDLCVEVIAEGELDDEGELDSGSSLQVAPKSAIDLLGFEPVFRTKNLKQDNNACFYLGPFREPFNTIYKDHVVPPFKRAGMTISRADEIFSTDVVIEDVWKGVISSAFIIADVSGRNPNVMYEIGMAHTVGRPVLMISQSSDDIPFDLRHRRCVIYEYTPRGCKKLEDDLARAIEFLRSSFGRKS